MRSNSALKRYDPYPKCVTNPTKVVPSTSKTISNSEITILKIGSQANLNKNMNNNNQENKKNKLEQLVSKVNEWVVESSNEITNKSQILPDEKNRQNMIQKE
jgi:hypothetical protein